MICKELPPVLGQYRKGVQMKNMTWFNVGGIAEVLFKPANIDDLSYFIKSVDFQVNVIGVASNLIIRDGLIKGAIVKLGKGFTNIFCNATTITVGCAVLLANLAVFAKNNGISGFEFMVGIPGTVGGAIAMNAGAYGYDISSVLQSVKAIDENGNIHVLSKNDIGYYYRGNSLNNNWIFIEATFIGKKLQKDVIASTMDKLICKRNHDQPIRVKTGGSTFKNPTGYKAWELIDAASCRGMKMGGAMVSDKHCNFLVNYNNATAGDLENLGNKVRDKVKNKFNIDLEWEIKFLG
ncbi:UDP-N-acetylmuramate dehydrogenase [Neoehrlichia mikurensis]|uniref:UDP-N-acetylenolpyruvoylglucosamine reductase n=1 Tax=Neoehrlichia mikurensis TaxID=89586 RepID=A0A9Q9F3T7_9RICK|nr:UDP-N-acetylmuramate dehydrogenase [Neoehrlichia mikurensis]QXK91897.1 UDP-N-acetylmuramate dehydrogenase [Neoehrlichia mikurensis]QXK93110.1 UDP-N-acetylmuramate dehydrogenase [Neoehrlichia mikurensis]QXK93590.1 UDP-N-acetylmuramate dehydrogenase [Neoehrlichia mikurensis]UTO55457.1 UDP-N-acetylmuramate dehydrogenase [Neoehrlichia mikurensis]UTO56377.1 UDP-N-acetylmuramate dehydrogenase [Neoehrlichia mikurensis]